jgi:hypothetical protein
MISLHFDSKKSLHKKCSKSTLNKSANFPSFNHELSEHTPIIPKSKLRYLKRVSPFLLLAIFLLFFLPYVLITGNGAIQSIGLNVILFTFILINVLFIDFALWNYFSGKKILLIWIIESILSFVVLYLLI